MAQVGRPTRLDRPVDAASDHTLGPQTAEHQAYSDDGTQQCHGVAESQRVERFQRAWAPGFIAALPERHATDHSIAAEVDLFGVAQTR